MMNKRTKTEERLYAALVAWEYCHRLPPTIHELIEAAGYKSRGSSQPALYGLRNAGLITWEEGKARTLRLVRHGG